MPLGPAHDCVVAGPLVDAPHYGANRALAELDRQRYMSVRLKIDAGLLAGSLVMAQNGDSRSSGGIVSDAPDFHRLRKALYAL
jgi:hypothetical protein